jgi:hypothetical protein
MPRPIPHETEAVNPDSFLDIVASVVSILIIMILMVGMRIKNTPVDAPLTGEAAQASTELEKSRSGEESFYGEVFKLGDQLEALQQEAAARAVQRNTLATLVSAAEYQIQGRRAEMDEQSRGDFDVVQQVGEARWQLEDLKRLRTQAENAPAEPIVVESYPTPISRAVDGNEVHFQLRGGSIAYIPLEALIERFKADALRHVDTLRELPEVTDTVGPEGGFRLKYTMERKEISPELAKVAGRGGSYAQLKRWTLIATASELGEPADVALAEGSAFRRALAKHRPGRNTVTIWLYPDSFDAFRQIRKELYRLGFAVAVRPLPEGIPISGSPEGSKSAAE